MALRTRVLFTVAEESPTLGEWLMRHMDAATVFWRAVEIRAKESVTAEVAGNQRPTAAGDRPLAD